MSQNILCSAFILLLFTKFAEPTNSVFQTIGKKVDILLNGFEEFIDDDVLASIRGVPVAKEYSDDCYGCQVSFTIAAHLFVVMNFTYSELEFNFNQVCQEYYFDMGQALQASRICRTVVQNYGPHIEQIARLNTLTASEACLHLTFCTEDDDLELGPPEDITLPPIWYPEGQGHRVKVKWVPLDVKEKNINNVLKRERRSLTDEGILRVAQITDIHVDEKYMEGTYKDCGMPLCCHEQPAFWPIGRIEAGPHGEWECNVPPETTIKFIQKVQEFDPHIVLYTGDSPSHHLWEETLQGQMDSTYWVAQKLAENIVEAPVYSTIGNHETFPSNLYWPEDRDTKELHEVFLGSYSNISGFDYEQEESIRDAGYYTALIRPGLRILAYNSNFGYHDNWYNVLNNLTDHYSNMTAFMRGVLENARRFDEKVMVITHHPVGAGILEFDEHMMQLMTSYSDVIIFNGVGHMHKDEFRLFRDEEGTAQSVQFLAQSANSYSYVNPSVRVYYFDDETLELLDFEQHFMNLTDGNITLLYRASEEYGLADLSPQSLQEFVWRMKTDPALFTKFWKNRVSATGQEGDCPESETCREETLCRLLTSTSLLRKSCIEEGIAVPTTQPPPPDPTTTQPQMTTTPETTTTPQVTNTPPGNQPDMTTESSADLIKFSTSLLSVCVATFLMIS